MVRNAPDVEPAAEQCPTGIEGFDGALLGGLPCGRTALIIGGPGSGKTKLALQFLVNGILKFGEPGLMVSFEESPAMLATATAALGLPPESERAGDLHVIDGRPTLDALAGGSFDIGGLVAIVAADIARLGIRRTAFDGFDALFALGGGSEATGTEFRRLVQLTDDAGVTSLICLKPNANDGTLAPQFHAIEYAADAVVRLGYRMTGGLLQRLMRIVKIRNAGFASGELPFIISAHGLDIAYTPAIKVAPVHSVERVSTGVSQLDAMLEGGLLRNSTTLVSGLPGTAKSTIGASFLAAGLARGEQCMLVALDEPASQLMANVRSVGINIDAYEATGQLATLSLNPSGAIADEHFLRIERFTRLHRPTLMVIDPISALDEAGGREVAHLVVERFTALVKSRGITAIFTAIASSQIAEIEGTAGHVSSIADTWIHLSFAVKGGERNRTLTIVKSRGTGHSNQLREMLLGSDGITLQDVYQLQGEFLLGTARLEREQEEKRALQARELRAREAQRKLEERKETARARLGDAQRELDDINERMTAGAVESELFEAGALLDRSEVSNQRGGNTSSER